MALRPELLCLLGGLSVSAFVRQHDASLSQQSARHVLTKVDASDDARWTELTPAGPFNNGGIRRTLLKELVPGAVWALEQVQGVIYVHVPVRCLIVELSACLLCYGGVAPTTEMLRLLHELEMRRDKQVEAIILPSTAIEHKLFTIALSQRLPQAELWIAPSQFSFPIDVPNDLLGLANARLLNDAALPSWGIELPWVRFGPYLSLDEISNFEEIVCVHKASKTLLCCDLLVSIPATPPDIIAYNDARALQFHARDFAADENADLIDGWRKICLFALYFQSGALQVTTQPDGTLRGAVDFFQSSFPPSAVDLGWGKFFAWSWPDRAKTTEAFDSLRADGALLVPPVIALCILNRQADDLRRVLTEELDAGFESVCSCHFDSPVQAGLSDVYHAFDAAIFSPLGLPSLATSEGARKEGGPARAPTSSVLADAFAALRSSSASMLAGAKTGSPRRRLPLPDADLAFLRDFESRLVQTGIIAPL